MNAPDPFADLPQTGLQSQSQAAPTWAQQPASQPSMMYPQQRKRKKANWKLPLIIGSTVAGVALVAAVVVVVINLVGNSTSDNEQSSVSESDGQTRAKVESLFERPPTNPNIVATNENWVPDKSLLKDLGQETSISGYTLRLPQGFSPASNKGIWLHAWNRPRPELQLYERIVFGAETVEVDEEWIRELESEFFSFKDEGQHSFRVERGKLNGLPCWRTTSTVERPSGQLVYRCGYQMLDGDQSVVIDAVCYSPPDSREYKILENALRTLKPE